MYSRSGAGADQEIFESLAALLRQSASRAMERLKMQRSRVGGAFAGNAAGSMAPAFPSAISAETALPSVRPATSAPARREDTAAKPIDVLVVQYAMYYLNLSQVPANHYVRLSQEIVTASADRVLLPARFERQPLPQLCEGLVAENASAVVEETLHEVGEYVDMRELLGDWLDAHVGRGGEADDDSAGDEVNDDGYRRRDDRVKYEQGEEDDDDGDDGQEHRGRPGTLSTIDLAGVLYTSLEFWLRVRNFILALSRGGSASAYACVLRPRYERELMLLLYRLSHTHRSSPGTEGKDAALPGAVAAAAPYAVSVDPPKAGAKRERPAAVKKEPGLDDEAEPLDFVRVESSSDDGEMNDDDASAAALLARQRRRHAREVATAVLTDALALSHCGPGAAAAPSADGLSESLTSRLRGVDPSFYAMVHARLGVMVARDQLRVFGSAAALPPPPLTVVQHNLWEKQEASRAAATGAGILDAGAAVVGLPLDYVPDDQYYRQVLEQQQDHIEEDEEVFKDEVVDYYLRRQEQQQQQQEQQQQQQPGRQGRRNATSDASASPAQPLMKPHRFCKVKTGFTWSQYNRTHYDSRTNPPPRTVMWYEFTLFYPALVNSKRDMRTIFHIEDTPRGPSDDYCLLVFSVGPPYADVAYRIVRKQWDPRRGGVRISFDATGVFKLFFRFTNSNYRR